MNERQQRRILYVADEIKEYIDMLKGAAQRVITENEDFPINSMIDDENSELKFAKEILEAAERLDKDLDMLYSVKRFPPTPEKETYLTSKD